MRMFIAFVALVLAAVPAAAEDLYNKDGVQLWTSARLVTRDAATCHVLEDRYPDEEYQRLKANEGQSLHVWRLDLTAANYSGKVIEYLRGSVDVESEWPPCTNWDWDVLQDYPGGVDWAGGILSFQQVADMQPGEEAGETMFLLAFHDQAPGVRPLEHRLQLRGGRSGLGGPRRPGRTVSLRRARESRWRAAIPVRGRRASGAAGRAEPLPAAGRDVPGHASFGRYGSGDGGDSGG